MKLELELKTLLEQEFEKVEQAVAAWEEILLKLARHLPEAAKLSPVAATTPSALNP